VLIGGEVEGAGWFGDARSLRRGIHPQVSGTSCIDRYFWVAESTCVSRLGVGCGLSAYCRVPTSTLLFALPAPPVAPLVLKQNMLMASTSPVGGWSPLTGPCSLMGRPSGRRLAE